jgi:hypothetical protein
MIRNILTHIGGVENYGVISICFFFAFFTAMLLWALRLRRPYLESMRSLPLEEGRPADVSATTTASPDRHE